MSTEPGSDQASDEQSFISHLLELRDRLLRIVIAVLLVFICLVPFAEALFTYFAGPLLRALPEGNTLIATRVVAPFFTPIKLVLVLAFYIASPYVLFQAWRFIAPGLYEHERRLAAPMVVASTALFYLGALFAYYVVFPILFGYLTAVAPKGVSVMTDIDHYLSFVLTIFFAFGIAFQVPIATIVLVWMGTTTPKDLAAKRPYIVVGAFVIGMLLTPPDPITQTLLAVPMWLLFELGVQISRFYMSRDVEEDVEPSIAPPHAGTAAASTAAATAATAAAATTAPEEADEVDEDDEAGYVSDTGHEDYEPLSEAEMDEELDRIDEEMDAMEKAADHQQDNSQKPDTPPKKDA